MLRLAIRRRNRTALWHYVFLYKPVKMLREAKTRLWQEM